jgi:site-specific recombinase XerD
VVRKGKTPVLLGEEARKLVDSISTETVIGLRDRALIALLIYTFARVSAAVHIQVDDMYIQGRRLWMRLHEKGGKEHTGYFCPSPRKGKIRGGYSTMRFAYGVIPNLCQRKS